MNKMPKWVLIFIIISLMMPILSIESIFPWILFFLISWKCINISKSSNTTAIKVRNCFFYTASAGLLTFLFNLLISYAMPFIINIIV